METIENTAEAWESGALGRDAEFARTASVEVDKQIDEALGMQAISIRLQKDLIEKFKQIANIRGIGYQPLMRDALARFADAEFRLIALELSKAQKAAEAERERSEKACENRPEQKHAA